jgi:SAM-dependent methyltransferase
MSADIFAGQLADPDLLAEVYDLEHDEVTEDLFFYREMAARHRRAILDLGCGSGRLFATLLDGGARLMVGVDGSPALLRRAHARVAGDDRLRNAAAAGRIVLLDGDVRHLGSLHRSERFDLVVAAGVLPHLDGPEEALQMLSGIRRLLAPDGRLVLDDVGPGLLPVRDLPLSVDWRRTLHGREVVRRSQVMRREAPEGLRVAFSTLVDVGQADGTIARLPASHRLWYPYADALMSLVREAGLAVERAYGSHDLDPPEDDSERRILMIRLAVGGTTRTS